MSQPEVSPAQSERLLAHYREGRFGELEAESRALVGELPLSGFAWLILGVSLLSQEKDALFALKRAVSLLPGDAEALCNLGVALEKRGRSADAEAAYRHAAELNPGYAPARRNLGNLLLGMGQPAAAETWCQEALALGPLDPETHLTLGRALKALDQFERAEASFRAALDLRPSQTRIHNLLGDLYGAQALRGLRPLEDAIASYSAALALDPCDHQANLELHSLYFYFMRLVEAKTICRRALDANPDFAEMHQNLSITLAHLSDFENVKAESDRAFEIKPDHSKMWEQRLYALSYHPDLEVKAIFNEFVQWGNRFPIPTVDHGSHDRTPGRRLRIGYVSPDFRRNTGRYYFWPMLSNHDRDAFEWFAYSNVGQPDAFTHLFEGLVDHWRDIRHLSDEAAADLVREDRIDILVDMCGHMKDERLGLFALKPAPIQATWLGSAWTTGLKAIDYVLYDPVLAPEGTLATEAIIRLPDTFLAFRPPEQTADIVPAPCLKNGFTTFGYSGRSERLNHRVFKVWGEILNRLPEARLILDFGAFGDAQTQAYYRVFLAHWGIDTKRVILRASPNIFEGLNDIDILLDSFPHNGGTMLMDAFWMGVPAVTLASRPPLGRICATMLTNLGLPDWIAASELEYVEKACGFASRFDRLGELRLGLRQRLKDSPLMDGPAFARAMEAAYRGMYDRWALGEAPAQNRLPGQASRYPGSGT